MPHRCGFPSPPYIIEKKTSAARLRWLVERWSWNNPPSFAKHLFGLALLAWKPSWIKQETNKDQPTLMVMVMVVSWVKLNIESNASYNEHTLMTHVDEDIRWIFQDSWKMLRVFGWLRLEFFFHDGFFSSCYPGRIQVASRGKVNGIAMDHERAMLRSRCDSIVAF